MPLAQASEFKAPPRSSGAGAARKQQAEKATRARGITAAREEALNGIGQIAHFGLIIVRQYADAGAVAMHGPPIAHEFATLADTNEQVAKACDYLMEAGPYAGLITAALPLAMQIMANHGIISAAAMGGAGVVSPEQLEAQTKTYLAQQAFEALRAQQEAEERLEAMARQADERRASQAASAATVVVPDANGQPQAAMGAVS